MKLVDYSTGFFIVQSHNYTYSCDLTISQNKNGYFSTFIRGGIVTILETGHFWGTTKIETGHFWGTPLRETGHFWGYIQRPYYYRDLILLIKYLITIGHFVTYKQNPLYASNRNNIISRSIFSSKNTQSQMGFSYWY